MSDTLKNRIKILLQNVPLLRDNSGELACHYKYSCMRDTSWEFFTHDKMESTISRISRELQNECPELRGERWLERQKFSQKIRAKKSRSQEKPEDLRVAYDLSDFIHSGTIIKVERESFLQSILRKFF